MYVYLLLQLLYTRHVLKMFFTEDCLVTDATFEDEILKIVKRILGFVFTHVSCQTRITGLFSDDSLQQAAGTRLGRLGTQQNSL